MRIKVENKSDDEMMKRSAITIILFIPILLAILGSSLRIIKN
jgi:hypothetical protein